MIKRIATGFLCALIGTTLMTSCLGSEDEVEASSNVALLSFSIEDLKTEHSIQTESGKDSTYTTVMSGNSVVFTIDQNRHLVYNSDSIAYGTKTNRVLVNVKADGGVCYLKPDGGYGSVEDTIDFTTPVTFRVTSYDERFQRDYMVSINVHQVNPKETAWMKFNAKLPALDKLKAFVKEDSLYVIGLDADGAYQTAVAALDDCNVWTTATCSGIEGSDLSALLISDVFYLKTDMGTYRSEDAVEWTIANDEAEITTLPGEGISRGVAWFNNPLRTNGNITRTTFVAIPEGTDTLAQVWTKLSTEESWVEVEPKGTNIYGCPNLEGLAVIQYADMLYAFGGKSVGNRQIPLEAFGACYESRDNGVTWKVNDRALSLPDEFKGRTVAFSSVADNEYVWVVWGNGEVWRGRWNGIK